MSGDSPATSTPVEAQGVVEERQMAGYKIRDHTPSEQRQAEQEVKKRALRLRVAERIQQFIDYAFVLLYSLLTIRLLLVSAAANQDAGFFRFIRAVTQPFYAPFVDIVSSPTIGTGTFELPIVIAMLAYLLLHLAVRQFVQLSFGTRVPAPT